MFDDRSRETVVLNWRGPLLAAGIFAAVFGVLLLMARENESKTSDMGSSLREDPYGTSLLFDSYRHAGYEVKRSDDEDTLSDENARTVTAFFIGGYSSDDWKFERGKLLMGEKFRGRLEDFLARGGRAVLVAPAWKFKSESQGWEVQNVWSPAGNKTGPTWISPNADAIPSGTEKMYLGSEVPWLETDAEWSPLYSAPTSAEAGAHVYMAMRKVGKGELIAASQQSFLLNEAIKTHPNPALLDFLAGGRQVIWVDETLHGLHQGQGVLWLVQRYRLQTALLLFWATLLVLLWSMSGDLVRRPARARDAHIIRYSESAGVAAQRLLQRSIAPGEVLAQCWEEFRRRSPQDAQAIASGPRTGPRLVAALAQPSVEGYRQLSQLIAERRASAKGLAGPERDAPDGSNNLNEQKSRGGTVA